MSKLAVRHRLRPIRRFSGRLSAITVLLAAAVSPLVSSALTQAAATSESDKAGSNEPDIVRIVAVKNVCAWPNLTTLPDGTIVAIIFNQPSHGLTEGDVECWVSPDGVRWTRRSVVTAHEPRTIRMNVAAGLAGNNNLLVVCSGWTDEKQPGRPKQARFRDAVLPSWICRSADGGRTWRRASGFPAPDEGWTDYIPFGDIVRAEDGSLRMSCYQGQYRDPTVDSKTSGWRSWMFRSGDDGASWQRMSLIGPRHNETFITRLGGTRWLAAARIDALELFRSNDDGRSWQGPERVTARNEINGHLLRLEDRRLLLTYGNRVNDQFGVLGRFSGDEGATWSEPVRLAWSDDRDCGYPCSVQRADGRVVTAYYAKSSSAFKGYHMGVVIWTPAKGPLTAASSTGAAAARD